MTRRHQRSRAVPSRIRAPAKVVSRPFGAPATKPVPTPFAQRTILAAAQEDIALLDLAKVEDVASVSMRVAVTADAQVIAADSLDVFTVEETDEEDDSSSSSEEAPMPYAAGSAA